MFVKIRYLKESEGETSDSTFIYSLEREVLYDCQRMSIGPRKNEPNAGQPCGANGPKRNEAVKEFDLIMDVGGQDERTVTFPVNRIGSNEVIEIYAMNDMGKTVERYRYR